MTSPARSESVAARVPLAQLVPSAVNPRRTSHYEADDELLESIRLHGILTPLLVRPLEPHGGKPNTFEIVAGHRRYAAATSLGLQDVPVTIRDLTDDAAREAAIIENLQREDLAPLDEAAAYHELLARPGQTPAMVAALRGQNCGTCRYQRKDDSCARLEKADYDEAHFRGSRNYHDCDDMGRTCGAWARREP